MVAASEAKPHAKMIGINHWYHHAACVASPHAVTQGSQHISFHPALLNLPSPLPDGLATKWSSIEDDETVMRFHGCWGDESILKLRYLIGKADVGTKAGGIQTRGLKEAKARQLADAREAIRLYPEAWEWRPVNKMKGRLSGKRARLKVRETLDAQIGGLPAARVIERSVSRRNKK